MSEKQKSTLCRAWQCDPPAYPEPREKPARTLQCIVLAPFTARSSQPGHTPSWSPTHTSVDAVPVAELGERGRDVLRSAVRSAWMTSSPRMCQATDRPSTRHDRISMTQATQSHASDLHVCYVAALFLAQLTGGEGPLDQVRACTSAWPHTCGGPCGRSLAEADLVNHKDVGPLVEADPAGPQRKPRAMWVSPTPCSPSRAPLAFASDPTNDQIRSMPRKIGLPIADVKAPLRWGVNGCSTFCHGASPTEGRHGGGRGPAEPVCVPFPRFSSAE